MQLGERFEQMQGLLSGLGDVERRLVSSLAVIVVLVLLRWVTLTIVRRNVEDERTKYNWRKGITYFASFVGLFLIGRVWFEGMRSLATFLGLIGAGLAVALKDSVQNLAGWAFILWRRPFVVGDRIQIGSHAGDVIDLRVFAFTLLEIGNWVAADQSTGRIVHVPNGQVFTSPLANYTRGFPYIWNELPVAVTFESDWQGAKKILLDIVERHASEMLEDARREIRAASRLYLIHYGTLTPTVYTSVVDHGVLLTIRYLCPVRARRGTAQAIWEEMLNAFARRDDIDLAYPTQRFFDHVREGKPAMRPPPSQPGAP